MANEINTILKAEEEGKVIFGLDKIKSLLKQGEVKEVFISANLPDSEKQEVKELAKMRDTNTKVLAYTNEELGTACKKPFPIGIIGILGK